MTFLTTSLVLAARSTDPSQYDDGLDWFRLGCEAVTLLWVLVDLALESYELGRVMLVFPYIDIKGSNNIVTRAILYILYVLMRDEKEERKKQAICTH